jgi:hypothetical protein
MAKCAYHKMYHINHFSMHTYVAFKNVYRGWGQGGEMTQALYAHMNNNKINK